VNGIRCFFIDARVRKPVPVHEFPRWRYLAGFYEESEAINYALNQGVELTTEEKVDLA
jgi:hypothetical protein